MPDTPHIDHAREIVRRADAAEQALLNLRNAVGVPEPEEAVAAAAIARYRDARGALAEVSVRTPVITGAIDPAAERPEAAPPAAA